MHEGVDPAEGNLQLYVSDDYGAYKMSGAAAGWSFPIRESIDYALCHQTITISRVLFFLSENRMHLALPGSTSANMSAHSMSTMPLERM
jgi:hypothetical protein